MLHDLPTTTLGLVPVKPGQPVKAEDWNRLLAVINSLASAVGFSAGQRPNNRVVFGNLLSDVAQYDKDDTCESLAFDDSVAANTDPWKSFSDTRHFVSDPQGGMYLQDERHALLLASGRLIPMPGMRLHLVKLTGTLNAGSTTTADIWRRKSDDSDWENTTKSITVHDWLLGAGASIDSGKKGVAMQVMHKPRIWILIAAEC